VHHKEVDWASFSDRTSVPLEVNVWHHGGIADWLFRRLLPRTKTEHHAVVDRHRHALLRQILSAHDGQEDERAEDDP
jgi:hypothetical protein